MRSAEPKSLQDKFKLLRWEVIKRVDPSDMVDFMTRFHNFCSSYEIRWQKCHRKNEIFVKNNKNWLDASISFSPPPEPQQKRGRNDLSFEECKEKTKVKKCKDIRDQISLPVLAYATQMSLRAAGKIDESKIVKEIISSPTKAKKYRKSIEQVPPQQLTPDEALSVLVEAKLSRHQYNVIRKVAPEKFPSYKLVQRAKKKCYPKGEQMKISETSAQVSLQGILDHTTERLLSVKNADLNSLDNEEIEKITLYTKWGFDGSSGHSSYKQAFHDSNASDSSVFITSIVPLKLVCKNKIIWHNPRPSSTRFCRPLKIEFMKETVNSIKTERERVETEKNALIDTVISVGERKIKVNHKLILVMIDGKVCNAITDTKSTQKCYICGATSKEFNNIEQMISRDSNVDFMEFGLSVLHGWIRFFECLIHLAYKLPIQKWQARSDEEKKIIAETKSRIQREFKKRTGLIIDQPKPGFGNSNDGNTARRFFKNAEVSAEITNIDLELIKNMHTILIVVSSGIEVNIEKFTNFANNTARLFVKKYPWYYMPPTLHKYFIHGPEIISLSPLPIGQLTEESQEARNKDFKSYRENFARKCSREKTMEDIFNRFLLSSDPFITSMNNSSKKKKELMPKSALELLVLPSNQNSNDEDGDEDGDED